MIITSTQDIPGRSISEVLGVVTGNTVQSKNVGKDFLAGLKTIVGGEISSYTEMMVEARDRAHTRMITEAAKLGADAIVCVRYSSSSVGDGMSEVLAYGTAVRLG